MQQGHATVYRPTESPSYSRTDRRWRWFIHGQVPLGMSR